MIYVEMLGVIDTPEFRAKLSGIELQAIAFLLKSAERKEIKGKPMSDVFKRASLFLDVKSKRACYNYAYSDGEKLYASNGYMLAACPTDKPVGYYNQLGILVPDVVDTYPQFSKKVAEFLKAPRVEVEIRKPVRSVTAGKLRIHVYTYGGTEVGFQENYTNILLKLGIEKMGITDKVAKADDGDLSIVVMPTLLPKE